jgi:hypothetical protein
VHAVRPDCHLAAVLPGATRPPAPPPSAVPPVTPPACRDPRGGRARVPRVDVGGSGPLWCGAGRRYFPAGFPPRIDGLIMSAQTVSAQPTIEWDDSVVFVFSFLDGGGNRQFSGFVHIQLALALAQGSATQVTQAIQVVNQQQIQFTTDAQCWLDTVKNAARAKNAISITFDDTLSQVYTTQTNQSFQLQQLFSLAG